MWPTTDTIWYLLFGLLPFFFLGYAFLQYGSAELLSLRIVVVFLIWVGYHLSPWIAYLQGTGWENFLLVPGHIDVALLFSSLAMFAILFGYSLVFRKKEAVIRRRLSGAWILPRIRLAWVLMSAIVLLALTIYLKGGFSDFWMASYLRGEGQWVERTWDVRLSRMINVIVAPLVVVVTLLASFYILRNSSSVSRLAAGMFGIFVACLPAMHGFSRMSGFPLLLLAFMIIRYRKFKLRILLSVTLLIMLALYMGNVGLEERGYYRSGIANYLDAALSSMSVAQVDDRNPEILDANLNSLDSVAPFTRRVDVQEALTDLPEISNLLELAFHINPIPSGIVDPGHIGVGLSEYMGTIGSVGLTSPALADLYYALGYFALLLVVLLGAVFGYFDRYAIYRPGIISQLAILLMIIGTGVSLHSGIRAWTRPMLYAFVIILIARSVRVKERVK